MNESIDNYQAAKAIVEENNLAWAPSDIGNLARAGLIRAVRRSNLKLFYVPDVLALYESRKV